MKTVTNKYPAYITKEEREDFDGLVSLAKDMSGVIAIKGDESSSNHFTFVLGKTDECLASIMLSVMDKLDEYNGCFAISLCVEGSEEDNSETSFFLPIVR